MPTALRRGEGVSAWRQIADALRDEILRGALARGAQLPIESTLAARFAVNRHTIRRALAGLAAEGLVRATQGRGTFVERSPLAYPIAARTRFSEIVARSGRDPGGMLVAAREVAAYESVASMLRVAPGSAVLEITNTRSADAVPLSVARSWMPLPRFAGLEAELKGGRTMSEALAIFGAGDYRRAETRITARPAGPEETARLELAPGRVVLVLDAVNVDGAGVPVQFTTSSFAADRVEIVVEE